MLTGQAPVKQQTDHALQVKRLHYEVGGRVLLDGLDLAVDPGQSVAITGPSGSGKSTFLMCLAGLLPLSAGTIRLGDTEFTAIGARRRAAVRLLRIGIVYQFGELLPELTPLENVALPALLASVDKDTAFGRAEQLLADLGVDSLASADTATLSGGERQRVAVARALVNRPLLLLADEPTGSLDSAATQVVTDLLYGLPKQYGCSLVMVTHNLDVARCADVQLRLDAGALIEVGA